MSKEEEGVRPRPTTRKEEDGAAAVEEGGGAAQDQGARRSEEHVIAERRRGRSGCQQIPMPRFWSSKQESNLAAFQDSKRQFSGHPNN